MNSKASDQPLWLVFLLAKPVIFVVSGAITTKMGKWADRNPSIYPQLFAGTGGLTQDSIVLLDQIRAIDAQRIVKYIGTLDEEDYVTIAAGIQSLIG